MAVLFAIPGKTIKRSGTVICLLQKLARALRDRCAWAS